MKDKTEIGIAGLPIPKRKLGPRKRHEFEKKRRKNLGQNVGGIKYKTDVNPYVNPREFREQKTFQQFVTEGKKKELRKALANEFMRGAAENPQVPSQPEIENYGPSAPGSEERKRAIKQMKGAGPGALKKHLKQQAKELKKRAKEAAKQIIKNP